MEQTRQIPDAFYSLKEAAEYMHVERQAVYAAIKKGKLKTTRIGKRHLILKADVMEYQASKYNRDFRMYEGEKLFDIAKGHLSVNHVAKTIAAALKQPYDIQKIYYLIRSGQLKAAKKAGAWVISIEDAKAIYEKELQGNKRQMRFA